MRLRGAGRLTADCEWLACSYDTRRTQRYYGDLLEFTFMYPCQCMHVRAWRAYYVYLLSSSLSLRLRLSLSLHVSLIVRETLPKCARLQVDLKIQSVREQWLAAIYYRCYVRCTASIPSPRPPRLLTARISAASASVASFSPLSPHLRRPRFSVAASFSSCQLGR